MFGTLLIANRGEIACRIARTAARLGVRTAAVYSDADADAPHVALADEAIRIGPPPPAESYLDAGRVLAAARAAGADAVHPGYGFLSENADFAAAAGAAGFVFVGPPPDIIRMMADKAGARALMAAQGIPVLPGHDGRDGDAAALAAAARRIGFPLMIKAVAGGGGRGLRRVADAAGFDDALAAAQREAVAAFGDGRVMLEACLEPARHIEVQVFADGRGNAVHLFERECSIQRRHQKVIEEAPAPGLAPETRARLGAMAVRAARAVGYVGAGTVEFIADRGAGSFFFMEMNTRLQVEHPVTEMVTGLDLVEWQLRVAAGEALPLAQDAIALSGHAVEARLCAEDPARGLMPSTGRIVRLEVPETAPGARIDLGAARGSRVGVHYDSLLAKLVGCGPDRAAATARLQAMLAATRIGGVATNLTLLRAILAHPAFASADIDTGFIAARAAELLPQAGPAGDDVLALAALDALLQRQEAAQAAAAAGGDPSSPWHRVDSWRLGGGGCDELRFDAGGRRMVVTARRDGGGFLLALPGGTVRARGRRGGAGVLVARLGGRRLRATVTADGDDVVVAIDGAGHRLRPAAAQAPGPQAPEAPGSLTAPMPGRVIAVHVAPGDRVAAGAALVVLEAMKMEHSVAAPAAGTVTAVHCAAGGQVGAGDELLAMGTADD